MSEERLLFICGSGISRLAPSWLPMAGDIKSLAKEHLLPAETKQDRRFSNRAINKIQPEVFFEQVLALFGDEYLRIWHVLRRPADMGLPNTGRWVPNLYHYVLVWIASQHGTPIVTFNMDTLLEDAAKELGLYQKERVYIAGCKSTEQALVMPPQKGAVSIWKIHGCIETKDDHGELTLHNTMSQIARPNYRVVQRVAKLAGDCKFCIVGYSGRDVDYFPHLCREIRNKMRADPVWIDPGFSKKDKSLRDRRELLGAEQKSEDLVEWLESRGLRVRNQLARKLCAYEALEAFWASRDTPKAEDERRKNAQQLISLSKVDSSFPEPSLPEKRALLVSTLLYSGNTRQGFEYAKQFVRNLEKQLPPRACEKSLLDFARLCDWNSKYEQYKRATLMALSKGKEIKSEEKNAHDIKLFAEVGALCLLTRARHMLMGPVVDIDWPDPRFNVVVPLQLKIHSFFMHLRTSVRTGPRLLFRSLCRILIDWTQRPSVYEVLARQYYLDHHQVFLNLFLRWMGRQLRKPVLAIRRRLVQQASSPYAQAVGSRIVRRLESVGRLMYRLVLARLKWRVERAGSAYTQADVYLFRSRYGLEERPKFARHIWSLVAHPVGLALLHLDDGEEAYREGRRKDAETEFEQAYKVAICCGNHLTALKALIAIFHVNRSHRLLNKAIWTHHVTELEGDRHKKYFVPRGEYL